MLKSPFPTFSLKYLNTPRKCVCVHIQGPAEVRLVLVWLVGYENVSHEMDSNLNISPKMSCGVLEWDTVMLHNGMLVIL